MPGSAPMRSVRNWWKAVPVVVTTDASTSVRPVVAPAKATSGNGASALPTVEIRARFYGQP